MCEYLCHIVCVSEANKQTLSQSDLLKLELNDSETPESHTVYLIFVAYS